MKLVALFKHLQLDVPGTSSSPLSGLNVSAATSLRGRSMSVSGCASRHAARVSYELGMGDPAAAVSSASDCRRFAIIESISKIALAANSAVICPGLSYWGATSTTS